MRSHRTWRRAWLLGVVLVAAMAAAGTAYSVRLNGFSWTVIGWNNLGMHCMDPDFSVFSLLPPYNTIQAQVIDAQGNLVTSGSGITVSYEAVADTRGSTNKSSIGKTNFWQYVNDLFGVSLAVDTGLAGSAMPGAANTAQPMNFDSSYNWFIATGIPITPIDDQGRSNPYPMMRIKAKDAQGAVLASTDIVLPVSVEMNCRACHTSNSVAAAMPPGGWVNDPDPERDSRLNVLKRHDASKNGAVYGPMLAAKGYNAGGLYGTVVTDHKAVLCAACHASEALGAGGVAGVKPLTQAVHSRHASVTNPANGLPLDASGNRTACYQCHPGSTTKCLRGAMGKAVGADGTLAMQCQSCHGNMAQVGSPDRRGWIDEPQCQSCHTGNAVSNSGAIRNTSAFDPSTGAWRSAVNSLFAVNPGTLYRFSSGHGGLQCAACHNSTHAEVPSLEANDNVQSQLVQGHSGVLVECSACHTTTPSTVSGGPHGMHPVGTSWVSRHGEAAGDGLTGQCRACHGSNFRGTVLSRSKTSRTLNAGDFGTKTFWAGYTVGCYNCHNGPNGEGRGPSNAPSVANASLVSGGSPAAVGLKASGGNGSALVLRIVSQPQHGTVGLSGTTATYFPDSSFAGSDSFTFAASDGTLDSNLGTVTVGSSGGGGGGSNNPVFRPDLAIRYPSGVFVGTGIFNTSAARQTVSQTSPRGRSVMRVFLIRIQNSGTAADAITLHGTGRSANFAARYTSGGVDVTAGIVAGSYALALAAGGSKTLRLEVRASARLRTGSRRTFTISARSQSDGTKRDAVRGQVTVR